MTRPGCERERRRAGARRGRRREALEKAVRQRGAARAGADTALQGCEPEPAGAPQLPRRRRRVALCPNRLDCPRNRRLTRHYLGALALALARLAIAAVAFCIMRKPACIIFLRSAKWRGCEEGRAMGVRRGVEGGVV